ncbi:bifunctional UDP-sugar hydrolase/5'-nucleotidase [Listeria seeligeri]|uniref:bifunctional metallophosphatase/5'-nucleotidase n=1 Tax=Listeria seeligeri TaxID=1640 RepID=UPI0001C4E831|nr:bifunctional UDP-sugar hydrolase/5'-nucleotidase [Listeria seeligeri]CBH28458.1 Ser/Thr protein phosphatase family protein [Listeria seeligeri serovar 1/2b str. SLCC3954]
MKHLTLWHTNDVHSHLEHWPRIFAFLKEKRTIASKEGDSALFFDIGDFLDRVHPLTEGTNGLANTDLLNQLPYDAVTFGNNEGTTLPHEDLDNLYKNAVFPVVCCNFFADKARTNQPDWVKSIVYKEINQIKVAIIGATAAFKEYYEEMGWGVEEPLSAIKKQIASLEKDTDLVIMLSHLGLPTDERIALEIPEVDVILGGHTHHLLENGKLEGQALLAAAGRWGEYVGKVDIVLTDDNQIHTKTATTFKTEDLPAPPNEANEIKAFFEKGRDELAEKVVAIPEKLAHNWFDDSEIAHILNDAVCEWTGAETFVMNAGIFMTDFEAGIVTAFDIHQMLPHPLNAIVLTMTGAELEILIDGIYRKKAELKDIPLRGFGFRGEFFGTILADRTGFDPVKEIALFDNKPIDKNRDYRIATHDTFVFAPFFPIVKQIKRKEVYTPELLRDILKWKLKKMYGQEENK